MERKKMSPEEPSIQEQEGSKPRIERDDERGALGQLSGRDGEEDEYTGPDPEQADDPPVPEEDQGV
jgi:hypothetical protein